MQFHKKLKRALRRVGQQAGTRINRDGMPNGFFLENLIWFGDASSKKVAVSRGVIVEPGEMETLEEASLVDLTERLRVLQATLGEDYTIQVRYTVGSEYSDVLEPYQKGTEAIADKWQNRWQI